MHERILDSGLVRYDAGLKGWCEERFFPKENWSNFQSVSGDGRVQFWPIEGTRIGGKVNFLFKEIPPASREKNIDNPSTLQGVSTVNVGRVKKNYWYDYKSAGWTNTEAGVTITKNADGSYTLNGTSTLASDDYFQWWATYPDAFRKFRHPNGTKCRLKLFILSGSVENDPDNTRPSAMGIQLGSIFSDGSYGYDFARETNTSPGWFGFQGRQLWSATVQIYGKSKFNNFTFLPYIQLDTEGAEIQSYEAPMFDTHSINLGSTYYGGSLDIETGLLTVTHEKFTMSAGTGFSNATGHFAERSDFYQMYFYLGSNKQKLYNPISLDGFATNSMLMLYNNHTDSRTSLVACTMSYGIHMHINKAEFSLADNLTYSDMRSFVASYFTDHLVEIAYPLDKPYTIQLTAPQIYSLIQSSKYEPKMNVIYTDADSIQIDYAKSPIRDEYEKIQAIASLGGNI